jgi:hypothetical protein
VEEQQEEEQQQQEPDTGADPVVDTLELED